MMQVNIVDTDTINVFVPMEIKKRGGAAMGIMPKHVQPDNDERYYDEKLIRAFAKAYQWRLWMAEGKVSNVTEIAKKEKMGKAYASRLYRLNFVAPQIVEAVLNGKQPRTLCLEDFIRNPP